MRFSHIQTAVQVFSRGGFLIVVDSAQREDEGDLVLAAEYATAPRIAFMVRHTSGLICAPMAGECLDRLRIPLMVAENTEAHGTAFTVSVDLSDGISTGISAADRARTLRALADPGATAADFRRPGHVFPLRSREGGILQRAGHTEAVIDLTRMAKLRPAGVICELVKDDGSMQRLPDLMRFSGEHLIPLITIADLIDYRLEAEGASRNAATFLADARI